MSTLIHADIFFFITTIAVILITLAMVVALIYVIFILRNIFRLSKTVEDETHRIISDVEELRSDVKKKGANAASRWRAGKRFFKNIFLLGSKREK
jgi:predicted membrane protein